MSETDDRGSAADGGSGASDPLRRLVDAAPFGAHVYDLKEYDRLVFVAGNESADRILGVDCSKFVGMTIEEAFPPLVGTPIPGAYRDVARTGSRFHAEQVVYDGGVIAGVFEVWAVQLGPGQVAAFFEDITERRRAEAEHARLEAQLQQAHKMEAIGALAGGIAHDFNNLLTAIAGYAELLRSTFDAGDPRVEDVDQIRKASDTAAALIRQLLAFSRQDAVRPVAVNLGDTIRASVKVLRRVLGEQVELIVSVDPDLDPILADETELMQVALNLAVNARDAMPGGGTLSIEVGNRTLDATFVAANPPLQTGRHVAIAFRDTGTGMDQATLRRVFDPFFTTKERGQGTGLGLSTVYAIATRSGGGVVVDTTEGRGSTFTVYWPSLQGEVSSQAHERQAAAGTAEPATILLVEDSDEVRAFTARILEGSGHRVLEARDATSAVGLAETERYAVDLLLSDIVMPGMNGVELAAYLHELAPAMRVMFISGYAEDALADADLGFGFRLLAKPFDPAQLRREVADVLAGR